MTKLSTNIPGLILGKHNRFGDIDIFVDKRGWVYKYYIRSADIGSATTASRSNDTFPDGPITAAYPNRFCRHGDLRSSLIGKCLIIYTDDDNFDLTNPGHLVVRADQLRQIPHGAIFKNNPSVDRILIPQIGVFRQRGDMDEDKSPVTECVVADVASLLNVRNFHLDADEEDNGSFVFEGVCSRCVEQSSEYGTSQILVTTEQVVKSDRLLRFSNLFGDVLVHAETDKNTDCDIFVVEGPDDMVTAFHKSEHFFVAVMRAFIRAADAIPGYRCILLLPKARDSLVVAWTGGEYSFSVNNQFISILDVPEGAAEEQCATVALTTFFHNPVVASLIKTE